MSFDETRSVADAVLYEGYALYPYGASSPKNRVRFPFGGAYPPAYAAAQRGVDRSRLFTECLVRAAGGARLRARLRCLMLGPDRPSESSVWQEAAEKALDFQTELLPGKRELSFELDRVPGALVLEVAGLGPELSKLRIGIENRSDNPGLEREVVLATSFLSVNLLLRLENAAFVSRLEPPVALEAFTGACEDGGLFPVLVGRRGTTNAALASPIILYDYPEVATSSPGDLFDATEIDEILSLRIQTLTDAEKDAMRALEPRTRALLERTEALEPADFSALHGELRRAPVPNDGVAPGTRVRLCPKRRADIFDLALRGKSATVRSLERDAEGVAYVCVTVDDDPGADLGVSGQPGHRFFFGLDEIEPLASGEGA